MAHGGEAGLLLLLDLLVLAERTPQSAKNHDHDDGHQQLVDGEAVLSGALAHLIGLGALWKQESGAAATIPAMATNGAGAPVP